jgi:peptidoglycan L-alanyl-D-glutamate endopeptidase CwlK
MTFKLGPKSIAKLAGVHPGLVLVVNRAIKLTAQDFSVTDGVRTLAEQTDLYAQGRTKPGPIVTWTLASRHLPAADGLGRAVDLVPYPVDWNTPSKFDAIAHAMFEASKELGIPIRWGADWDQDGKPREAGETDSPHFELA